LDQTAYLKNVIERFKRFHIRKADTPMVKVLSDNLASAKCESTNFPHQRLMGSLIWMLKMRPDIVFEVLQCARHMSNHSEEHDAAAMRILGYLVKNPDCDIGWKISDDCAKTIEVKFVVNSSWADVLPTSESFYGYFTLVNGGPVAWRCKRTPAVCMSSA
jgi:hypothetical protein